MIIQAYTSKSPTQSPITSPINNRESDSRQTPFSPPSFPEQTSPEPLEIDPQPD